MGKSNVITCDRCGRDIITDDMVAVEDWIHVYIYYHGRTSGIPEELYLCTNCKAELKDFIHKIDPTKFLKEPKILNKGSYKEHPVYLCPECRSNVEPKQKFCSECGLPLDWKRYYNMESERNEEDDSV